MKSDVESSAIAQSAEAVREAVVKFIFLVPDKRTSTCQIPK